MTTVPLLSVLQYSKWWCLLTRWL